jgi:pimeloyl-ACP methyl ester carboxylesterase
MTPLARTALVLVGVPLLLYAAACALLFFTQRSHLYFPMPRQATDVATMPLHGDGADLVVSLRERPGPRAVLYFGGNAEDVSQAVPDLAAAFPDAAVYAMHYRSYGGSTGQPTEAGLVGDAFALFDAVHAKHDAVTVIGRSLGSGVAVQLAAARPAKRLVLVTPYDSMADVGAVHFPWAPVSWIALDRFDSVARAPGLTVPVTVLVAGRDVVVPNANTRRLVAAFKPGVATVFTFPEAGHNDISTQPGYANALRGGAPPL